MPRDVLPLRRNRDFLLLWSGSAVSMLGSNASGVAYPLLVLALTGAPGDAGLAGFVALLPQLLFQVPAGVVVDRVDRRRLMIGCDLLCVGAIGSLAAALLAGRLTLPHILVVGFVEGVLAVTYRLAAASAVPHLVHPTQVTFALSRNEARARGAAMLGQPLGGALFGLGRAVPFLFDLVTYLVSLVALLLIRGDFQRAREPRAARAALGRREFVEGAVWLWRQPFLRATTLLVAGSNFLFRALFLVVIVLAADRGAGPATVGLMLGVAAVGGLAGSLAAPAVVARISLKTVVVGANWAWAALVPLLLVADEPLVLGAVYALMCFVGPLWNVATSAYQLAVTPDRLRGRVLGAAGMVAFGAVPLGSVVGGYLLSWRGAESTIGVLSGWMLLCALFATLSPSVRAEATAEAVAR
ncbi:MFS transporter [Streptomyces sedi]|uniref:MFS transporter n=1 Tax=Streptomyces sedi TaxID=555059 RepID=A0A5C4UXM3_9ACTN|nr:MFS transporter [Streptomyces sedi]TNM28145.1 MFS transporter [Streptomyces sedi]